MKQIICCLLVCSCVTMNAQRPALTITISGYTANIGCNSSPSQVNLAFGFASAVSSCPGLGDVTISITNGPVNSLGCNRSQTRTWTAKDMCKNVATTSRTVNWKEDRSPPFIISPPDKQLACNPTELQINSAFGNAAASDSCGAVTIVFTDNIISSGCSKSKKRTWVGTDGCGNTSTTSTTVSWTEDLIAPVISIPALVPILGCNPSKTSIGEALGQATVTDNCGTPVLTVSDGNVVSNGCARSQTRTWTAFDLCGNQTTRSRTVNWTVDISTPIITAPPNVLLGCNPSAAAINAAFGNATATDDCGVAITFANDPVISSGCNKSQQRIWTATDGCGSISTASNTVSWTESILTISITGDNLNRGCNPTIPVEFGFGTATANGTCSEPVLTISDGPLISNSCNRSKTRTWTATDNCSNTVTASRTVTWIVDQNPPVFTGNYSTVNLGVTPSQLQINQALNGATATDDCSTPTITSNDNNIPTNDPCLASRMRVFTVRDACGNTATISRQVTWIPCVTNPLISIADLTVSENAGFARVNVFLSGAGSSVVTVKYKTSNGTARAPGDYTSTTGTVSFPAGIGIRFFDVPIIADNITEGDENFFVTLSNAQNGTINDGSGTVTITNAGVFTKAKSNNERHPEHLQTKITIPNPQRRNETLKFNGIAAGSFDVTIMDMQGKVIIKMKNYMNTWKLSAINQGIYIYQLQYNTDNGSAIKTGKILITD